MSESFTVFVNNGTSSYDSLGESTNWDGSNSYSVPNESSVLLSSPSHPNFQLPYYSLVIIAVYLTVVGLVSTIGNILFIITVMRWWIMRNNAHMLLLLNMAICDLAISITGYPYTTISGYAGRWIFGELMCQLYGFLCFTLAQVTMNTLVAVSIFRYIAICKPHCKHLLTTNVSNRAIVCIWIHALFWTSAPLFGWSGYALEPNGIACSFDWNDRSAGGISYVIGCIIFCYVSHIGIMSWCYMKIFLRMHNLKRSHDHRCSKIPVESQLQHPLKTPHRTGCESTIVFSFITENLSPLEIHVLRMNIIMVMTYTLIWTPYAIVSIVSLFYANLSPVWYIFPTVFAKTSCMVNPIIYGLTNKFLRKELLSVIRKLLGLTTPMEEFQVMRLRQQEGLYNKEGIFMGIRSAAAGGSCTCAGCVNSRKEANRLMQQQRLQQLSNSRSPSPLPPKDSSSSERNRNCELGAAMQANVSSEFLLSPSVKSNSLKIEGSDKEYRCNTLDLKSTTINASCGTKTLTPVRIVEPEERSSREAYYGEESNISERDFKHKRSVSLVLSSRNIRNSTPCHKGRRRNSSSSCGNKIKRDFPLNIDSVEPNGSDIKNNDNGDCGNTATVDINIVSLDNGIRKYSESAV